VAVVFTKGSFSAHSMCLLFTSQIFSCGSFISALFAGISLIWSIGYCVYGESENETHIGIGGVFCGIGILTCVVVFLIGIWVTCYLWCKLCTCCDSIPPFQASDAGVGIGALQTVSRRARDNQPHIVQHSDSTALDNSAPAYEAVASGSQTVQVDMPPSYEEAVRNEWRTYV